MGSIHVTLRSGEERTIEASPQVSVMEAIRDSGIDDILALCGGCCSCATCHVHVAEEWASKLGDMSEDEDGLLEGSDHRDQRSRLSCQIPFTEDLDGLRLTIAQED